MMLVWNLKSIHANLFLHIFHVTTSFIQNSTTCIYYDIHINTVYCLYEIQIMLNQLITIYYSLTKMLT